MIAVDFDEMHGFNFFGKNTVSVFEEPKKKPFEKQFILDKQITIKTLFKKCQAEEKEEKD